MTDEERAKNCLNRGGMVGIKSPEKDVQQQRELTALIAIYPSRADIPSSPREPTDPYGGIIGETVDFGAPKPENPVHVSDDSQ